MGRVPRPVLPDLHAVVLPDVVPHVPGQVPWHGLHQVRLPGVGALSGRLHRRAVLGRPVRLPDPPRRNGRHGAQAAHHPGPLDLHVHDRRELHRLHALGHLLPGRRVLWQRPGVDHVVAGFDTGACALVGPDRRRIQLRRQPVVDLHAHRHRLAGVQGQLCASDRLCIVAGVAGCAVVYLAGR